MKIEVEISSNNLRSIRAVLDARAKGNGVASNHDTAALSVLERVIIAAKASRKTKRKQHRKELTCK